MNSFKAFERACELMKAIMKVHPSRADHVILTSRIAYLDGYLRGCLEVAKMEDGKGEKK